jgi:hypothetical protein
MNAALRPWRHGTALWLLIMGCESVNGSLRESLLKPWLGAVVGARVGFAIAALLVLLIAYAFAQWLHATTLRAQLQVGMLWAVLTFAFEAAVAWTMGLSLAAFLADYDPRRGGLMLFGLGVLLFAPVLAARLPHARAAR